MEKLSFFKLPFIFVVLLIISNLLVTMIGFTFHLWNLFDDFYYIWSMVSEYVLFQLFYLIPDCLLFFVVASIALYRMNVHIITLKNIGLLVINIFFINVLGFLLDRCQQIVYDEVLVNIVSSESWTFDMQLMVIFQLLYFSLTSLLTYYFIKLFGDWFDKSKQAFELTQNNSPNIHFILFLAFFFFLFIMFASFLQKLNIQLIEQHFSYWSNLFLPLIIYLINFLIVFLLTKNLFKRTFVVLQSDRIIKSATIINILIFIINSVFFIIKFYYWPNNIDTAFIFLSPIIMLPLSLVLSYLIIRYVTKYYFVNPSKG